MNEYDFALDVKSLDGDGTIEGLAAGYGNLDHGGDVMLPGSVTKSITGRKSIPMLMFHDQQRPVGAWTAFAETDDGLLVKGRFAMATTAGKEAHAMTKDGAIGGLSVGYNTLREKIVGKARHLIEVALHEVSLVTIPMNSKAIVTSVKSIEEYRVRLAAGERLTEREWDGLFKSFGLSNAEAERAVRVNLKNGQGEPDETGAIITMDDLWAAMRNAPIIDMTGE